MKLSHTCVCCWIGNYLEYIEAVYFTAFSTSRDPHRLLSEWALIRVDNHLLLRIV